MEEGILGAKAGKLYPYDYMEIYLFGYNNRYGFLVRRALGGPHPTMGAEKGLYMVSFVGLGLRASEVGKVPSNKIKELIEPLPEEDLKNLANNPALRDFYDRYSSDELHYNCISKEEIKVFEILTRQLEEREAKHKVKNFSINPAYASEAYFEYNKKLVEDGNVLIPPTLPNK